MKNAKIFKGSFEVYSTDDLRKGNTPAGLFGVKIYTKCKFFIATKKFKSKDSAEKYKDLLFRQIVYLDLYDFLGLSTENLLIK